MGQYSEEDELRFIEGLYGDANNQLKDIYKQQRSKRDDLLKEIANILLVYTIANNVMNMSKLDSEKELARISALLVKLAKNQAELAVDVISNILANTVKNTYEFYSYNYKLKEVKKIIDNSFKGKHFSKRVWSNEEEVAKNLHRQVQDFLNGKVNVNQIKKSIEKTYNNSAYEVKRLVETEVNRCEDEAFRRFCKETGVKKVKRNEVLDSKTCSKCAPLNGKVYNLDDAPGVVHPLCRGFNTIEE